MKNVRFSLVIPAYGVEKYLRDCLESIAAQSCGDFEAIVVDDGSPDGSGRIADVFAAGDARFQVIHKQNEGVSIARNTGLARAAGEWIWFIDGDDLIAPDALETLSAHLNAETDMLLFGYADYGRQDGASHVTAPVRVPDAERLRLKNIASAIPDDAPGIAVTSASFCLYRNDFLKVHGLKYDPAVRKGEDSFFNFGALCAARRLIYVDAPLYIYRRNENSISVRYNPQIVALSNELNDAYRTRIAQLEGQNAEMQRRLNIRVCNSVRVSLCLGLCNARNRQSYAERRREYRQLAGQADVQAALNAVLKGRWPLPQRALLLLIRFRRFWLLNLLYRSYTKKDIRH